MRVFVTGASGWIGSAVVPELVGAGHTVLGLARSDEAAQAVAAAGAEVLRGSLDDLDRLEAGAAAADGVIHLAYHHDFSQMEEAAAADRRAIETMGRVLEGSGRPLLIASGTLGLAADGVATEEDEPDPNFPRSAAAALTLALADRGVRPIVVRLPPTVHGDGDHGFVAILVQIARERGASAYIGEGINCWSAVHRLDAAVVYRLALDHAPARSVLHAVADEGVATRTIAEVIGRHLDLPVVSVSPEVAGEHFGWMAMMFGLDGTASSAVTRELLGWEPTHPGLVEDLELGHYFRQLEHA